MDLERAKGQCQYDPCEIWAEVFDYAKANLTVRYEVFLPIYLSSLGAHLINHENLSGDHPFFTPNHRVPNLAAHIFAHGPPGFSKSYYIDFFFDPRTGIAYRCFPSYVVGNVTAPGFIGSYSSVRGRPVKQVGIAEKCRRHIICAEEFSSLNSAMKQSHSTGLDAALLSFLDKGKVNYDMKWGVIDYSSFSTLWTGSQPERMELASGVIRRLQLIDMTPDTEDIQRYKESNLDTMDSEVDWDRIEDIRAMFYDLWNHKLITGVTIHEDVKDFLREGHGVHWEDSLHLRLAIGYTLMTSNAAEDTTVEVQLTSTLKSILKRLYIWRHHVVSDPVSSVILTEIQKKDWPLRQLRRHLATLGISRKSATESLEVLKEDNIIKFAKASHTTRPITVITKGTEFEEIL